MTNQFTEEDLAEVWPRLPWHVRMLAVWLIWRALFWQKIYSLPFQISIGRFQTRGEILAKSTGVNTVIPDSRQPTTKPARKFSQGWRRSCILSKYKRQNTNLVSKPGRKFSQAWRCRHRKANNKQQTTKRPPNFAQGDRRNPI